MPTEKAKWKDTQIKTYENAIRIAKKSNNKEKIEEYRKKLDRLRSA